MAGDVSMFAGEVECLGERLGHLARSIQTSGGNVAVGAESECVVLPVMAIAAEELTL